LRLEGLLLVEGEESSEEMEGEFGVVGVLSGSESEGPSAGHGHGLIEDFLADALVELAVGSQGVSDKAAEDGPECSISFQIITIFFEQIEESCSLPFIFDLVPELGVHDVVDFLLDGLLGQERHFLLLHVDWLIDAASHHAVI
jgi:hypothetical protein